MLGKKLVLGVKRIAGFSSLWWCVEFLLPRRGLLGAEAQSGGEGGWQTGEELGGLGELLDRTPELFFWVGLSRAAQGTLDSPQTLQTASGLGGDGKEANRCLPPWDLP